MSRTHDNHDAQGLNGDGAQTLSENWLPVTIFDEGADSSTPQFDAGLAGLGSGGFHSLSGAFGLAGHGSHGASTPTKIAAPSSVTVADGGHAEIAGPGTIAVDFAGTTGTLAIEHSTDFRGNVTGLEGSDTLDLADIAFNASTQATFLGNESGGTLTVTNGAKTSKIELTGDYLSSTWTISSDGNGGTNVVDPTVSTNWQMMKIGAGGFADGLDEAPDGTIVVRTDTNGAYLWNGTSWQQLVTSSSMPAAFIAANPVSSGQGVYEIQIAPSNSNIMYMMFNGYVFVSSNKGTTWSQTSFARVTESPNDSFRWFGEKMAVDPNNSNIVFVGTPQNGLWVTTNGGSSWSQVSAVPVSKTSSGAYPGITGILFDPAIGGVVNGATQTIFAYSYGNGVYESTNGGSTWTLLSGGPPNVQSATIGPNGAYYAVSNNNQSLWRYYNGAWTDLIATMQGGQGIDAVAINPKNPNEIVAVAASGYLDVSYDGGATWSGIDWSAKVQSAAIPWEAAANTESNGSIYLDVGGAAFSTTNPNELVISTGTGAFDVNVPTTAATMTGTITYNDMSLGIENLVANQIIVAPGGVPILASWDRPFIQITSLDDYPTTYGPVASTNIVAGWSVDYASSTPSFLVGIADWWGVEESGYSTNGGTTWTKFATEISGAGSSYIGGDIAASTTQNFIWAPADGNKPYYTLNGGQTWNAITLPGVSSWSNFDPAYYLVGRTVTADRVLANTFYMYDNGVFETTDGGATWSEVYTGAISPGAYNLEIMSVPGEAGNLFFTAGIQGNGTSPPSYAGFYFSSNQGKTWTAVPNVLDVITFGFGAAAPGQSYPAIYIVGYVNKVYGIWQSTNQGQSWAQIGTQPAGELDQITTISGDPNKFGEVYVGFAGGGYAYLQTGAQQAAGPTVTGVTATPASGIEVPGNTITFIVNMSAAVTVSGGTPTLSLNDGGVASYVSGSGSSTLTFAYTVSTDDSDVPQLAISSASLNGATVADSSGNSADFSGAATSFPNISIDPPYVAAISETPASGDLGVGKTVTFTVTVSDPVTVAGGTPTLTLNDGGVATYASGSGTNKLTFSYTVGASNTNVSSLSASAFNLNGATIQNSYGASMKLGITGIAQSGPQVDVTTPAIASIAETPASGSLGVGSKVTFALTVNDPVTVAGGTPTLTLNDGGVATYASGSGTNTLKFSYTVAGSDTNVSSLSATAFNLNGATIQNGAGVAMSLGIAGLIQTGPQISAVAVPPAITSITESPSTGDLAVGKSVTFTLKLTDSVIVSGGAPLLRLNDGGVANYVSGSGTNTLTFSYTVSSTDTNVSSLAVKSISHNGASVANAAGTSANLSFSGLTQAGPQIDTTTPAIQTIVETPASGVLAIGAVETLAVTWNEVVTVSGGVPTLTLNDGGVATYTGGSGSNTLTFSHTVAAGEVASSLTASALNLKGASIANGAGTAAGTSLSGVMQAGPQIDTITPAIQTIAETPASGAIGVGGVVTLAVTWNDVVTVSGGVPTLTLNDGGVATYTGGSNSNTLTFSYTVAAGQSTASLTASSLNLNGASIANAAGTAASKSLSGVTQSGPQIDTITPAIQTIAETPASGTIGVGGVVTLAVTWNDVVTVAGGAPTLTLNDGGVATYTGGSGSNTLKFSTTVAAGQSATSLAASALNLTGATIANSAGTSASLSLASVSQSGPAIVTQAPVAPALISIVESPAAGKVGIGSAVAVTLNFSGAVVVSGGVPTLTLNNGGIASYAGGSGTTALTFNYTVAGGQSTSSLAVTGGFLNGATVASAAGVAANLSGAGLTQVGPQVLNEYWLTGGTFSGSNDTVYLASSVSEAFTGVGDVIWATSTGDSLTFGGNGMYGIDNIFMGSGASIALQTNSRMDVGGSNNSITVANGSTFGANGNNNQIVAGSGDALYLNAGTGIALTASNDKLYVGANVSATVTGTADVFYGGTGDIFTFSGGGGYVLNGSGDQFTLNGVSSATVKGANDTLLVGSGDVLSLSGATGTKVEVGSLGGGTLTFATFAPSNSDIIDLLGGVGGYGTASAAANALASDGSGGSLLSLGAAGTLHFQGVAPSSLSASNFAIG